MNYGRFNKVELTMVIGVVFIILALIILVTDFLDGFVTSLLWPLLEGSSEGKTVIFLGIIGSLLIFNSIISGNEGLTARLYPNDNRYKMYLKVALVLLLICAIVGLLIEVKIRYDFGVSIFTILTSMDPNTSTTSLMHSHAYKSVLGFFANGLVPSHVNTGSSILKYVLPYALIVIPVEIIAYFTGLFYLVKQPVLHKIVGILALSVCLIGLLDGGMFSQPFLIGFGFLLLVYFSDGKINIKYLVNPVVIMGYILLVGMILEIGGSDTAQHTLTVINQTGEVDLSQYNVTSVVVDGDKTIYTLDCDVPDKTLIRDVFAMFKDKSDLTFMSWNFYTYFDNPNTKILKNR